MSFVNTIDELGDDIVFGSIVDGTITDFKDDALNSVASYTFRSCDKLSSIVLPSATSIGGNAFQHCSSLTSVNLPSATSIGKSAFTGCYNLASVDLPKATSIENAVFSGCTKLASVNFPVVISIGSSAFYQCSLTTLILRSETMCALANTNAFSSTPIASGTGYIYVPEALVEEYKVATNWSTYANQFRAIEDYPDICG